MRQTLGAIGAALLLVAALVAGTIALGDPSKPGCGLSTPGSCDVRTLYRAVESVPVTDDYEARALMLLALGQIRTVDNHAIASINKVYQGANAQTAPCIRSVLLETIDENHNVFTTVGGAGNSWDQAVAAASSSDFLEARRNYLSVARSRIGGSTDVLLDSSYAARVNNMKKCSSMRKAPVHVATSSTPERQIMAAPKPVQPSQAPAAKKLLGATPPMTAGGAPQLPLASPEKPHTSQKTPVAAPAQPKTLKPAPQPARPSRIEPKAPGAIFVQQMPSAPPAPDDSRWFAADAPFRLDSDAPSAMQRPGNPQASNQGKAPKAKKPQVSKPKKPHASKAPKKNPASKKPQVAKAPKKNPASKKPHVAKVKPNPGKGNSGKVTAPPKKPTHPKMEPPKAKNPQSTSRGKPGPSPKSTTPGQAKKQADATKGKKK